MMKTAAPLKLMALDEDDLAVVSAHLQDALAPTRDMAWLPKEKRFALLVSRFDWAAMERGKRERACTGLHFDRVTGVSSVHFDRDNRDAILNLLAIRFEPGEAPAGHIVLTFSGGVAIRLAVECVEAQMRDMGPRWRAGCCPGHKLEDEAPPR
jgi:hypothetical protein